MVRRAVLILLALAFVIVAVSCGKNEETAVSNDIPGDDEITNSTDLQEEAPENADLSPDDGQKEEQRDESEQFVFPSKGVRPYAVMIDNQGERCLPQGGLSKAQVIYEIIVEGGLTRLMPLFWGVSPEMIGPVRSSRHYFLDYALEHDAIYVHFGWSIRALNDLRKFKVNNIDGYTNAGSVFWDLTKDPSNWQDTYTSMEKLDKFTKDKEYRTNSEKDLVFEYNQAIAVPENGSRAEKINIRYSSGYSCGYEYDSQVKKYMRFKEGKPQTERLDGEQLAASNIIIQYVKNYTIEGDDAGRQELETVGSGKGYYITAGKCQEIKWSKSSRTEQTKYTYLDGSTVKLNPGQTWIQIVPLRAKIEIE